MCATIFDHFYAQNSAPILQSVGATCFDFHPYFSEPRASHRRRLQIATIAPGLRLILSFWLTLSPQNFKEYERPIRISGSERSELEAVGRHLRPFDEVDNYGTRTHEDIWLRKIFSGSSCLANRANIVHLAQNCPLFPFEHQRFLQIHSPASGVASDNDIWTKRVVQRIFEGTYFAGLHAASVILALCACCVVVVPRPRIVIHTVVHDYDLYPFFNTPVRRCSLSPPFLRRVMSSPHCRSRIRRTGCPFNFCIE